MSSSLYSGNHLASHSCHYARSRQYSVGNRPGHPAAPGDDDAQVELTHNWDPEEYDQGRNFGHLAYAVDDIYEVCQRLLDAGVTINRPPHDGRMAFVRSPDNISIELLQNGAALPAAEPWISMGNTGHW